MEASNRVLLVAFSMLAGCRASSIPPPGARTPTTRAAEPAPPAAARAADRDALETCSALRGYMGRRIESQADDDRAQAALDRCLAAGALKGLARGQVEELLGPGRRCGPPFRSVGVQADDVCYEVGRLPVTWLGGVPNLVLAFDEAGRCVQAIAVHTQ